MMAQHNSLRLIPVVVGFAILLVEVFRSNVTRISSSGINAFSSSSSSQNRSKYINQNNNNNLPISSQLEQYAHPCYRLSHPNITLKYPADAAEHFLEIHQKLRQWMDVEPHNAARFGGPWIENYWIDFGRSFNVTKGMNHNLYDFFGPYIPLFVPWVDMWVQGPVENSYPKGFLDTVKSLLRPDVPYITVSQCDTGIAGAGGHEWFPIPPNVLVLSSGGYGNVPIPLFIKEQPVLSKELPLERRYNFSFSGNLKHSPARLRKRMHIAMNAEATNYSYYFSKKDWQGWIDVVQRSKFNLAPRGAGRTSYHLMEILQMGRIPVHIHCDIPWVPYQRVFETIGYHVHIENISAAISELERVSDKEIDHREKLALQYRRSHFTTFGAINQIELFLHGKGDLECVPLPKSVG
mmetsp:Transcript_40980/g.98825  ORF Transcript_40980/g.98825 Transcript_40980/m.98825 type:complete len:407 (-) Transcript_40980:61-1281(-)